jgi:thioredoxin 1
LRKRLEHDADCRVAARNCRFRGNDVGYAARRLRRRNIPGFRSVFPWVRPIDQLKKGAMAIPVTEQSFEEEVLQSEKPVIVDFWAEWCGPCHAISPILDRIVEERHDELKLVKVNVDEQPALQQRFGIQSIPTIILFKDGQPAAAAIGAQPKPALEKALGLVEA